MAQQQISMATVDGELDVPPLLLDELCQSIQELTLESSKNVMQDIEAAVSSFTIDRACLSCYMAYIMPYLTDREQPILVAACGKDCECDFEPCHG